MNFFFLNILFHVRGVRLGIYTYKTSIYRNFCAENIGVQSQFSIILYRIMFRYREGRLLTKREENADTKSVWKTLKTISVRT